jgi:hypothetical protein
MAAYTAEQLRGEGILSENLSGVKTFTFNNPSSSAYFTLETVKEENGYYNEDSPTNCDGIFNDGGEMGYVASSYIASFNVREGVTSFSFQPAQPIDGSTLRLRGTGEFSLIIS